MGTRKNALGWPSWAWYCLLAITTVTAVIGVVGSGANLLRSAGLLADLGRPGATYALSQGTPAGWSVAGNIWPEGPAAKAGIRHGDLIKFEYLMGHRQISRTGWSIPIIIERDGATSRSTIRAAPSTLEWGTRLTLVMLGLQALVQLAFGTVLLLRGKSNHAAMLLGLILVPLAVTVVSLPIWAPGPIVASATELFMLSFNAIIGYVWPLFSLEISGGAASPRQAKIVGRAALAFAAVFLSLSIFMAVPAALPLFGSPLTVVILVVIANQAFGYGIIAVNFTRNDSAARNRIKIVTIAFFCFLVATILILASNGLLDAGYSPVQIIPLRAALTATSFAGLGLLGYGVLRQKLFDLNFALNRTLVYGVVSFILLASFGLGEWAAERFVPETWHESGTLISAGIALALFLSFHRLRDWVERHVERLLFRRWHENEATLRRFIAAADHFGGNSALLKAFSSEVARFAKGAETALYLRSGDHFGLQAGKLSAAGKRYPDNDRALALMRAERRPVDLGLAFSALPGVLALPMLDQGALLGFALLGPKPDGTAYRPDEVEVLGWAAQQVGFAAQAQHVRQLEGTIDELRAQVAALSARRPPRPRAA